MIFQSVLKSCRLQLEVDLEVVSTFLMAAMEQFRHFLLGGSNLRVTFI